MENTVVETNAAIATGNIVPLLIAEGVLLFLVLVAFPIYAICKASV